MTRIEGGPGPIGGPVGGSSNTPIATVQLGETNLSQVAGRLGLDKGALQQANPDISPSTVLKAGQDINLPQSKAPAANVVDQTSTPGTSSPGSAASHFGDSLNKNFVLQKLDQSNLGQVSGGAGTPANAGALKGLKYYKNELKQSTEMKPMTPEMKHELQTKIFEMTQDITVNKAKTADKAYADMDKFIRE